VTAERLTLATAVFAALSAFAALLAVLLDYRKHRAQSAPWVTADLWVDDARDPHVTFNNVAQGAAINLRLWIVDMENGKTATGSITDGVLAPGAAYISHLAEALGKIPAPAARESPYVSGESYAMWWCEDVERRMHFWGGEGRYRRFPEGHFWWHRERPKDAAEVLFEFYPRLEPFLPADFALRLHATERILGG
jgi:hypothetical protein